MKDVLKKGITLGLGLAMMGKEQVEKVVDELVSKGEVPVSESKNLVNEIMSKGEMQQQAFEGKLREKIKDEISHLNVATKTDIRQLEERIKNLENRMH